MILSYPWYIGDWHGSQTRLRLNPTERGIYRELLDWAYRDGSLPNDEAMLARMAGCNLRAFRRAWRAVKLAFTLGQDGLLHQAKVDEVRPRIERWHEQRREAGRARMRMRSNADETQMIRVSSSHEENHNVHPANPQPPKESTKRPSDRLATAERPLSLPLPLPPPLPLQEAAASSDLSSSSPGFIFEQPPGKEPNSGSLPPHETKNENDDDDRKNPSVEIKYLSERGELTAFLQKHCQPAPDAELIQDVSENLELRHETARAWVADLLPRMGRLHKPPGPGFFLKMSKDGSSRRAPPAPQVVTAAGRCAKCGGCGRVGADYCACGLGRDLVRSEAKLARKAQKAAVGLGAACGASEGIG